MNSQFKRPLGGNNQAGPQNEAWLTGNAQPIVPSDQTQGRFAPARPIAPQPGVGLSLPAHGGQFPQAPQPSAPASLPEQPTIKQPSFTQPLHDAQAFPQMPNGYVQGQQGRYGPGPMPSLGGLPMPNTPQGQMFAAPQQRSSMGSSFAAPQPNTLNQNNTGASFSRPAATMLATPPAPMPGTFNPNRPPSGPDGKRPDGPLRRDPGGKRKKKRRVPIWARVVIGFLTFLLVLGGGSFWYYQVNFANTVNNIVGQTVPRTKDDGADPNADLTNGILTGPRVNILLLGSDTDEKFQGTYLAQTDIIITIDPSSKTVGMLSIPRDFYLNVPGYGMHKLDEAYGLGGVALSRRTIEQDFGIPINNYAWVGLDGFIKVIDTVNGVDVDVLHPIVDGNYPDDTGASANNPYALERLYLPPGPQHLDGPTALEYVRSRHADLVGDFGRSARQQQVLSALKTKLVNPNIFGQLQQISNDLNG
ncbi:MAG: LCP family protein, partial [Ktedonobacteraceae bacterium]